jgi:hypothetical protein
MMWKRSRLVHREHPESLGVLQGHGTLKTKWGMRAMKKKSMRDYLPNASEEYWLISDVDNAVIKKFEKGGDQALSEPERVVATICKVLAIIENGGLAYFFEHTFDVEKVAKAYEVIGIPRAASILRKAIAKFPNSQRPESFQECMRFLDEHEEFFESLSKDFLESQKDWEKKLASYIKRHPEVFSEFIK